MLKNILMFLVTVFITTFLLVSQTTISNLMWLSSLDMPVNASIVVTSIFHDLISMNTQGEIPAVGLVAPGMVIAFIVARIALIWIPIKRRYVYAFAGGAALLMIVLLMPLAFYNLDLLAGARSTLGKLFLVISGILGGYFFGTNLTTKEN
tara:strand:- start:301 stop:750 length:450 start_codon:yes stop_codon:yes gene_type:complete